MIRALFTPDGRPAEWSSTDARLYETLRVVGANSVLATVHASGMWYAGTRTAEDGQCVGWAIEGRKSADYAAAHADAVAWLRVHGYLRAT